MILTQLYTTFFKIGLFSFGGGYAMIPLMEKEVVRLHSWLTLSQMADVIAVSQMTPGPIAINLATFVGFKTVGLWGAVWATLGVITPSVAQTAPHNPTVLNPTKVARLIAMGPGVI